MATGKTLIAYATKGGVTEDAASLIAEILSNKYNLEVDIVNLGKTARPDLEQYRNVIVGSGVRMQRVYRKALKFLGNNFENKKVAIFLSSAEAGDPKSHDQAILKYIMRNLAKPPNVRPVAAEAFGGRIRFFGKTIADTRNMEKVKALAEDLGKKLD